MTIQLHLAARWILTAWVLITSTFSLYAQWHWPIEGAKAGENLLLVPQQYLEQEHNFSDMIIAAPAGTPVLAPADGTIRSLSIGLYTSLTSSYASSFQEGSFNEHIAAYKKQYKELPVKEQYITGFLSLFLEDGSKLHICGLQGDLQLKTGMKIKKGQQLGVVAYCYHKIQEPSIMLSISTPDNKPADPMSPFGIPTTFKPAEKSNIPTELTALQAQEDFSILMKAYQECYPSLDEIVTPQQFKAFEERMQQKLTQPISYAEFYQIVRASLSSELVHDSHICLLTPNPGLGAEKSIYVPHLMMGILGDSLIVTKAEKSCAAFIGKTVAAIDGERTPEIIQRVDNMMLMYDGDNESHRNNSKLTAWNYIYGNQLTDARTCVIEFTDGTSYTDHWIKNSRVLQYIPFTTLKINYIKRKYEGMKKAFDFQVLNDSTVLFSLHSFTLNQLEMEQIEEALQTYAHVPNLIIDIRNNPGGDVRIINQLASYLLDQPAQALDSYLKVNSNGKYESFRYSMNYHPDFEIFQDYEPREGKSGYYAPSDYYDAPIVPDSLTHYPGRLYLLTDESSISAATLFPALLVRNRRAVTVGRETLSGYHYMTAYKFINLMLPNSKIQVRIPLVKTVFDETITTRTPKGRGLIPDYEVLLSYEEIFTAEHDIILEKALELIAAGQYLREDAFAQQSPLKGRSTSYRLYGAIVVGLIGTAWLVLLGIRRRRR